MDSRPHGPDADARGTATEGGGGAQGVAEHVLAERALRGLAWLAAILLAVAGGAFLAARWGIGA